MRTVRPHHGAVPPATVWPAALAFLEVKSQMITVVMATNVYLVAVFIICVSNSQHVFKNVESIKTVAQDVAHLDTVHSSFVRAKKAMETFAIKIENASVVNASIKFMNTKRKK